MPRLLTLWLAALPLDPIPLVQTTLQCTSVLTMPSRCTFLLSPCSLAPCTFWSPGRWASLECAWRASPGRSTTSLMRATVAARGPMPSFPISTTTLRTMGSGRRRSTCTVIIAVGRTRTGMSWPTSCGQGRGRGRGRGRGGAAQRVSDSESSSSLEEEEEEMRREMDSPSPSQSQSWSRSRSPARSPRTSPRAFQGSKLRYCAL